MAAVLTKITKISSISTSNVGNEDPKLKCPPLRSVRRNGSRPPKARDRVQWNVQDLEPERPGFKSWLFRLGLSL